MVLASALLQAVHLLVAAALTNSAEIVLNTTVLLEGSAAAIVTTLLAGLFPALRLSRVPANAALRSGGGRTGTNRHHLRLRAAFVVVQVALSLTLMFAGAIVFRALAETAAW